MKDERYLEFRATLKKMSTGLVSIDGYNKFKRFLGNTSDWDQFQEALAQIDITLWFKDKGLVKEIEPGLPHRQGYTDILLSFSQKDIYCEITSLTSLIKSIEAKSRNDIQKVKYLLRTNSWMTQQDAENEIRIKKIVRKLLEKTNKQLPSSNPGIIALETGKAMVFHHTIKDVAERIFTQRPQLILIMLWSLEKGSQIGEAPFPFVNPNSPYQNIVQKLLEYLGLANKVTS